MPGAPARIRDTGRVKTLRSLRPALLLLTQLGVLACAARWGLGLDVPEPGPLLLAAAAPALLIALWALFGARRAPYRARGAARIAFLVLWCAAGVAAALAAGETGDAIGLAVWTAAAAALTEGERRPEPAAAPAR